MPNLTPQALRALVSLIVGRMGSNAEETEEVADHLVRANLSGHDSHGVGMLPAYVRLLQDGLLVPNQTPHTVLDAGALLVIDARRGFGQRMTAEAAPRVDHQQRTGVQHRVRRLVGHQQPVLQQPDIGRQHADAVAVVAGEVGAHQMVGDFLGFLRIAAHAANDEADERSERLGGQTGHGMLCLQIAVARGSP